LLVALAVAHDQAIAGLVGKEFPKIFRFTLATDF
jgi:hypothetical protein